MLKGNVNVFLRCLFVRTCRSLIARECHAFDAEKRFFNMLKMLCRQIKPVFSIQCAPANVACRKIRRYTRGQGVIELIIGLVMFSMMLALMSSVSIYLYVQHSLVSAAREGARIASLDSNIGGTNVAAGQQAVITRIQDFMRISTGQEIPSANIVVTAPSATAPQGSRTVAVEINHVMNNPIAVGALLRGLGADPTGLEQIPVSATATMRYEE
jgi:Flp pilus assembly protein TadG